MCIFMTVFSYILTLFSITFISLSFFIDFKPLFKSFLLFSVIANLLLVAYFVFSIYVGLNLVVTLDLTLWLFHLYKFFMYRGAILLSLLENTNLIF